MTELIGPVVSSGSPPRADELLAALTARTRQQAAIVDLGQEALGGARLTDLFDRAVELLVDVLPIEFAKVLRLGSDHRFLLMAGVGWQEGLVGSAVVEADRGSQAGYTLLSDSAVVVDDLAAETRFSPNDLLLRHRVASGMSVIIRGSSDPYGILAVHSTRRSNFSRDDVNCLQAAAHVLSEAIQREASESGLKQARDCERALRQKLERYSRDLRNAHESERQRIARELHDEVGQTLTALKFLIERIEVQTNGTMRAVTDDALTLVADLLSKVHNLSLDLRPSVLDDFGLAPSLVWLARRFKQQTGIDVQLHHDGIAGRLPDKIEVGVYRILQEALTNVARHANVDRCVVRCSASGGILRLVVHDCGLGFDECQRPKAGLAGMTERARALGGRLTVRSRQPRGTLVRATIPLIDEAE